MNPVFGFLEALLSSTSLNEGHDLQVYIRDYHYNYKSTASDFADENVNGNNKLNPRQHMVYRIYQKENNETIKYGISDYEKYKEQRPKSQLKLFEKKYGPVDYEVRMMPDRKTALMYEIMQVYNFKKSNEGKMPDGMIKPAPGFSHPPEQFIPLPGQPFNIFEH